MNNTSVYDKCNQLSDVNKHTIIFCQMLSCLYESCENKIIISISLISIRPFKI